MMVSREDVIADLRGSEVVIPDLYAIFRGWVQVKVNPHYHELVAVCDKRLER
jgi:hypothetical protein